MDGYPSIGRPDPQPAGLAFCPAKALGPFERQELALEVLARTQTVSRLAQQHEVSRKFIYRQTAKAHEALQEAFALDGPKDDEVLFSPPVTKSWLRQLVLELLLVCHSSGRGVVGLLGDLFD